MIDDPGLRRLEEALTNLDADKKLPPNWRARVLAETRPRRSRWRTRVSTVAAVCAAAAVWLLIPRPDRDRALNPQIALVDHPVSGKRGTSATVGDAVEVKLAGAPNLAIWIYRNDELMLACPGTGACVSSDGHLSVTLKFEAVGTYALVTVFAKDSIPSPEGKRDPDLARAERTDAIVREHKRIVH